MAVAAASGDNGNGKGDVQLLSMAAVGEAVPLWQQHSRATVMDNDKVVVGWRGQRGGLRI